MAEPQSVTDAVKAQGLTGKCPVDHTAMQQVQPPAPPPPGVCPVNHAPAESSTEPASAPAAGVCPVNHGAAVPAESSPDPAPSTPAPVESPPDPAPNTTSQKISRAKYIEAQQAMTAAMSECPSAGATAAQPPSECPMHADLDTGNMMPPPNQRPAFDQPFPLSIERETSSIPRYGTGKNWVYPSEQMFWNAMTRKGWNWREEQEEVSPESVSEIIKIHNFNNEKAWNEILLWEKFYEEECGDPQLVKFQGRPRDMSPKARFLTVFRSWPRPFDRHDWVVNRCGKEVRYILDYYDVGFEEGMDSVLIDVRPALDSIGAIRDRFKVFMLRNVPRVASFLFEYPMIPSGMDPVTVAQTEDNDSA